MSNLRYEFLMSQISPIRDIQDNEKTQLHMVQYAGCQGVALLRVCKGRDVSELYKNLMQIRHPNLTVIYDCVYANGNTYVVEEYISGRTLEEILVDRGTFSEQETIATTTELCKALEVLHGQNPPIIHNDIKSSNVMIRDDGSVKLFDFDISRIYKEDAYKNTKLMGTYEYAAPEHYGFGQSEPCTDIYSLGVTMHEMLTGEGLSPKREVTYTGGLAKVIGKCVEIDPKKRYSSAVSLGARLERYAKGPKYIRKMLWSIGSLVLISVLAGMAPMVGRSVGVEDNNVAIGQESEQDTMQEQDQTATEGATGESSEEVQDEVESSQQPESQEPESQESEIQESETQESEIQQPNTPQPNTSDKEIEVTCDMDTWPMAMQIWPDGTFIWMENLSGQYWLKTSTGKKLLLEGYKASQGASISWDPLENSMILSTYHYDKGRTYKVTPDLIVEDYVYVLPDDYDYNADMELAGSVYNNSGYFVLNDRFYTLPSFWNYQDRSVTFLEVDMWGSYIDEFTMGGNSEFRFSYSADDKAVYNDGTYLYFVAAYEGKTYLISFDGDHFKRLMCISDYKGWNSVDTHTTLWVTEETLYLYNESKSLIMQFER